MRTQQDLKDDAVRRFGGTEESQKSVQLALKWLASTQEPNGSWDASEFEAGNGPLEPEIPARRFAGQTADTGITAWSCWQCWETATP